MCRQIKSVAFKLSVDLLKQHRLNGKTMPRPGVDLRFVQFCRTNNPQKQLGVVSDDGQTLVPLSLGCCCSNDMITFITQDMDESEVFHKIQTQPSEEMTKYIELLPPVTNPEKIVCTGPNYLGHCLERNAPLPKKPTFFSKYASTLTGPTGDVIAHKMSKKIDWEVALAVIIGKQAKNVPRDKVMDYVFGYSIAQDISARDLQRDYNGELIGKSMDTFCPLGPAIVHKSVIKNPHDLQIITRVNGVHKQEGNTKDMIFKVDEIIYNLTKCMTLRPGDVILTGTPAGVGMHRNPPEYLKPGDVIESEIENIGKLINTVVAG